MMSKIIWTLVWSAVGLLMVLGLQRLEPPVIVLKIMIGIGVAGWIACIAYGYNQKRNSKL